MAFWNKKTPEKVEPTLEERLKRMEGRITLLEAETMDLATAHNIIRNKVLKKIQFKKVEEEEEKKDLYNGMFIPE